VLVLDPAPTIGPVLQSGAGKDINILSDADCEIKNVNAGNNISLFGDTIYLNDQAGLNYLTLDTTEITSFKNVNMDNNAIGNVNEVKSAASLSLGSSANFDQISINPNPTTGVSLFADTGKKVSLVADGGNNIVNVEPTKTDFFNNIDMNSTDVDNVSNVNMVNDGSSELTNVFRISGSSVNSLYLVGNLFQAAATSQDVIFRCNNPSSCIRFRVGTSPTSNRMFVCDTDVDLFVPLIMNGNDITDVGSINGLSPIGGNSSGTSNSALLTASTTETSIMPLTFVGSRQVPADTFQQGDCFSATLAGSFGSANGDDLTIRLKGGATGTTLLSSEVVPLSASSASSFELKIEFSVRQTGAAGVAELVTNYVFTYNQSGGGGAFVGERNCEINTTTFDTTILNQLDITAEFSSANASNSIQTFLSNLHKIY